MSQPNYITALNLRESDRADLSPEIQKYFDGFDKNELFFSNPTSNVINFSIDSQNYTLKPACSRLIDIFDQKIITIKSNCLFFRPTVFSYKSNYMDVHHS